MKHEIDSGESHSLESVGYGISKELNYLFKRAEILESVEKSFSTFISNSLKKLHPELNRGDVYLNQSVPNTSDRTPDTFGIWFSPSEDDKSKHVRGLKNVTFISSIIGKGKYLTREIEFFEEKIRHPALYYLNEEYIPFLKELFNNFGFQIVDNKKD